MRPLAASVLALARVSVEWGHASKQTETHQVFPPISFSNGSFLYWCTRLSASYRPAPLPLLPSINSDFHLPRAVSRLFPRNNSRKQDRLT